MGDITTLAWVSPIPGNPKVGYLFASCNHPIYSRNEFDSKVYQLDLAKVEDGVKLKPLNISFLISQGSERFEFIHGLGNNSVLCVEIDRLDGKKRNYVVLQLLYN